MTTHINWIPAHPSYGSISMFRYWKLLAAECRPDDPYRCQPIIPLPVESAFGRAGKLHRAWQRKIAYPLRVRLGAKNSIAHILDHSWAEMLDFVPRGTRTVVTVHDLIPLRDPGGLSTAEVGRFRDHVLRMKSADAVIAVSEYTRQEVIDLLDIDPERVHVVPNGVDAPPMPSKLRAPGTELRIGSVGSILPRKNLAVFPPALRAYRTKAARPPHLIRAGMSIDHALRSEMHAALGTDGFEELGRVSDAELEEFYASLDVLVIPSHYEGFGLPVLEAMVRGVPVIAARSSSLPEVGGDAALYFDPNDPEELAERLNEVADPVVAAKLSEVGLARAAGYSWRATLEGFYRIYDML